MTSGPEIYKRNIPTILVIFGITGDLTKKKALPALFHLFVKGKLPRMFRLVGFSRRDLSRQAFKQYVREIIIKHFGKRTDKRRLKKFLELIEYRRGRFARSEDYKNLAQVLKDIDDDWGVCANKIFYLAVPPNLYGTIFNHLASSKLTKPCGPDEGWTRILVEKPFGGDEKSAKSLERRLGRLFKEIQIYRIDHYLAKEMLQNILTFRFSNNLFENDWNNHLIEKISIRLLEGVGVEDRGGFYDSVGALRDVGQNHLLQMLALTTMERPKKMEAGDIRRSRAELLKTLKIPTAKEIINSSFRAQYDGYRRIKGVSPDSRTETYFKIRLYLTAEKWLGVPVTIESGKRMGRPVKDITVIFRHTSPCLCPDAARGIHYKNSLVIHLEPQEGITINFWSKKPGFGGGLQKRTFNFNFRKGAARQQYTEEYEKLLLDCIAGDQTLFVASDEVTSGWKFIDPIVGAWSRGLVPLRRYRPDSAAITKEAGFLDGNAGGAGLKKEIGIVGLGKMGANLARHLRGKEWKVFAWNRNGEVAKKLEKEVAAQAVPSLEALAERLGAPRIVWLMLPAGRIVDKLLFGKFGLTKHLRKGDIVIDGGNSFYLDSIRRAKRLKKYGIDFLDVGVSGGPAGALNGASLMIGGERPVYGRLEKLFSDLATEGGYGYMGKAGAGHFVKMAHNGIEYGMMQALAEGFAVLKKSPFRLNLRDVADVYNHGSVITSRLVGWLRSGLDAYGEELKNISGSVAYTGEGEWTVKTAKKLRVAVPVIKSSLAFRKKSFKHPTYIGKLLTVLRNQFGGHSIR